MEVGLPYIIWSSQAKRKLPYPLNISFSARFPQKSIALRSCIRRHQIDSGDTLRESASQYTTRIPRLTSRAVPFLDGVAEERARKRIIYYSQLNSSKSSKSSALKTSSLGSLVRQLRGTCSRFYSLVSRWVIRGPYFELGLKLYKVGKMTYLSPSAMELGHNPQIEVRHLHLVLFQIVSKKIRNPWLISRSRCHRTVFGFSTRSKYRSVQQDVAHPHSQ